MTIRKGSEWGAPREPGQTDRTVNSDAELAHYGYSIYLDSSAQSDLVSPVSGDVLRTLGVQSRRDHADQVVFPFDLGLVQIDGGEARPFVAHVICRNWLWSGQIATIMNVGWCGDKYFGPRAHPNDGLLDITEGSLSFQQRLLARSRLKSGNHLPHPDLRMKRRPSHSIRFERPTAVFVDGVDAGRCTAINVDIVTDAFNVVA